MPRRPLRPCTHPGCPRLVARGACPEHERARQDQRRKDPEQARFYGSARWQAIRRMIRERDPICTVCQRRASTQVHHLDGRWDNNDPANLAGICGPCHASESGRQHRGKR